MARRAAPPEPQPAKLTVERMKLGISRLQRRIADLEAFDPEVIQKRWGPEVKTLETAIEETLASVFGHNTIQYNRYKAAADLDNGPVIMRPDFGGGGHYYDDRHEAQQYVTEGKEASIQLLRQAIRGLQEEIADQGEAPNAVEAIAAAAGPALDVSKIFVVHGHDEAAREAIARFIQTLGFQPIILHERANEGRTVIEKVEAHGNVGFAVVLLTPDDEGCVKGGTPGPRARQNVVLELGYFIGRLGRNRVCALKRGELEIPSDFGGVVGSTLREAGNWPSAVSCERRVSKSTGTKSMNSLVPVLASAHVPELVVAAGERAGMRFLEFFAAKIRNPHTRRAYARAADEFLAWCASAGVPSIGAVEPVHVATWIEASTRELAAPSVKQRLAAIRHLFDWLVTGQVVPVNPAASVRGPRHVVTSGQTPVLDPSEARALLDSIDTVMPSAAPIRAKE
jgi:predicted nucleotide-binding protein